MAEETLQKEQKSKIVPLNQQNIAVCKNYCGTCPTHEQCGLSEFLFCSRGKSNNAETITQRGCNCPDCEVWMNYSLSQMYFCIQGEA